MYDYIIVGAGPTGLTLSLYLSKLGKKVLLIEKEESIGGCHRVNRINGLFSEHGPRIYINNYLMFMDILKHLNTSFHELFVYDSSFLMASKTSGNFLSFREIILLAYQFFKLNWIDRRITVKEYAIKNNFSEKAIFYLDRMCRLTDGAGIDRYTLYQFLQIVNQHIFYGIYQPRLPNDISLLKIWKDKLIEQGVDILLNSDITSIKHHNNKIISVDIGNKSYTANKYILTIPPYALVKLFQNTGLTNVYGDLKLFKRWEKNVRYLQYIPVCFHWNKNIILDKKWNVPNTEWGVAYVILTDFMKMNNSNSKTVISTCVTIHNVSSYINKKPNECTDIELHNEVFRQLKLVLPTLPKPTKIISTRNNKDIQFMSTKHGYKNFINNYKNLFTCGPYNGNSTYAFTSLEMAVANAMHLLHYLEPTSKELFPIKNGYTLTQVIIFIVMIILIIYKYIS
jgi:hypothetical protein